jgi:hypothetical protein
VRTDLIDRPTMGPSRTTRRAKAPSSAEQHKHCTNHHIRYHNRIQPDGIHERTMGALHPETLAVDSLVICDVKPAL